MKAFTSLKTVAALNGGQTSPFYLEIKVFGSSFEMCPFGQTMVTRKDWEGADQDKNWCRDVNLLYFICYYGAKRIAFTKTNSILF